ncbi:MAG: hypothetical protein AMK74_02905 [Nitrospira bacterium SM23_35]|jgi:hypothetical protein|nr:MAG: hypothetical protein AMK74_02905 [Nitrospira bacterium SM23_35]
MSSVCIGNVFGLSPTNPPRRIAPVVIRTHRDLCFKTNLTKILLLLLARFFNRIYTDDHPEEEIDTRTI